MNMLSERSPQRVHGKGKRVAEHSNYHCERYSTNLKRAKIKAGNLPRSDVEISRNSKADSNVVVQAETSRIAELNDSTSKHLIPPMQHGKAKDLQQEPADKNMKVVGNEANLDEVTARDAFHASGESKRSSYPVSLASRHSLPKREAFKGLDLPPANSGVLTNRVSQPKLKSMVGALKIGDKQDFSSSARSLDKKISTHIAEQDQDKLKQVIRDKTCKVDQRKPPLEYRWKLKDEEDELHFSSSRGQNGDRANEPMNGSQRVSFNPKSSCEDHSRPKPQRKSDPEPTEAQQESKKRALTNESDGSGVPKLHVELSVSRTRQPTNFAIVHLDECQQLASRDRMIKVLKQFNELYTHLIEQRERAPKAERTGTYRADLKAANILRNDGKWINCYPCIGNVPGVQIGDRFQYRAELAVIGLHREFVCGIHYEEINGITYATSIVDSGRYYDNKEISIDEFYYMGEGANPEFSSGLKHQTRDGGNLALMNSMHEGLPVRVIRGRQTLLAFHTMGVNKRSGFSFFYDGLYKVTNWSYSLDRRSGKYMFRFTMERATDDPNLAQKISYEPRKSTIQRKQVMIDDMHRQKEKMLSSTGKDVKFSYDSKPNGYGYKIANLSSRHSFSLRKKDEKFDYEAAAHLAKPVVSTRPQYAKRPNTIL